MTLTEKDKSLIVELIGITKDQITLHTKSLAGQDKDRSNPREWYEDKIDELQDDLAILEKQLSGELPFTHGDEELAELSLDLANTKKEVADLKTSLQSIQQDITNLKNTKLDKTPVPTP